MGHVHMRLKDQAQFTDGSVLSLVFIVNIYNTHTHTLSSLVLFNYE